MSVLTQRQRRRWEGMLKLSFHPAEWFDEGDRPDAPTSNSGSFAWMIRFFAGWWEVGYWDRHDWRRESFHRTQGEARRRLRRLTSCR